MRAILEFDLNNQEDEKSLNRCLKATDMASVIWEFTHNSRKKIEREFESETKGVDVFDGIERCFEHFYKLLEDSNVNINELYE